MRAEVVKIAAEFPRFGYRMIRGEFRRRGFDVNAKRVRRRMREENLEDVCMRKRIHSALDYRTPAELEAGLRTRVKSKPSN